MYDIVVGKQLMSNPWNTIPACESEQLPCPSTPYTDAYDSRTTCFFYPLGRTCESLHAVVH